MSFINRGTPIDRYCDIHFTNFTPIGQAVVINTPTTINLTGFTTTYSFMDGFTDLGGGQIRYDGTQEIFLIMFNYIFLTHSTGTSASIYISLSINGVEVTNSKGLFIIGTSGVGHSVNYEYIMELNTNDIISFNINDISRSETISFQKFSTTIKSLIQL